MKQKEEVELALFSCPKAFSGHIGQIQANAWRSWRQIPSCSVYIMGNEAGVEDFAAEQGFSTLPTVRQSFFGTPRLDCMFEQVTRMSTAPVLAYVNSDIILLPGLIDCIREARAKFERFLVVARRWNFSCHEDLDFSEGWDVRLKHRVMSEGTLFTPYGIDLFVFTRGMFLDIPPFAVGRDFWDNALIMLARKSGVPVIDATSQLMIVHQDHSYGAFGSPESRRQSPESRRHFSMLGDSYGMLGRTTDATHVLENGQVRPSGELPITIIIPHRGEIRSLCRCLLSLENQSFPRSFIKVLIVNNDAETPLKYLEQEFPAVTVVREYTAGPAAARNKGVCCSDTKTIAFFDSDTVVTSTCLENAIRTIDMHPECDVLVCGLEPTFSISRNSYLSRSAEWFDATTHYNQRGFIENCKAFASAAMIVRTRVFDDFGFFNEVFPEAASEDWEWSKRIMRQGAVVMYAADAVAKHPTTRSIQQLRAKKQRYARGDCIYKILESNTQKYLVFSILRHECHELWTRLKQACQDSRLPAPYRIGYVVMSMCCFYWTVRTKLSYRKEAARLVSLVKTQVSPLEDVPGTYAPPDVNWRPSVTERITCFADEYQGRKTH